MIGYLEEIKKKVVPKILSTSIGIRNKIDRKRLRNRDFTILACNCAAGCIYHDLGMAFDSPTINLYIYPDDYIKFLKSPQYYIEQEISFLPEEEKTEPFPVGVIGGGTEQEVKIFFNHYKSNEEADKKWHERATRIHWDNIFVLMSDQNGCTEKMAREFDELPYAHKIFYSCKPIDGVKCLHLIPDCGRGEICTLTHYINMWGKRYYAYKFDYVRWLNQR